MRAPDWSAIVALWILTLALAAGCGAAWEWSAAFLIGVLLAWALIWIAVQALHGFLVPKEPAS